FTRFIVCWHSFSSLLCLLCFGHLRHLHSFPTRRSSDLNSAAMAHALALELGDALAVMLYGLGGEHAAVLILEVTSQTIEHYRQRDRKSTRLNSSHVKISYAVFCLKKKISRNKRNEVAPK